MAVLVNVLTTGRLRTILLPTHDRPNAKKMLRLLHERHVDHDDPAFRFFWDEEGRFRWDQYEVRAAWRIQAAFLVTVYLSDP